MEAHLNSKTAARLANKAGNRFQAGMDTLNEKFEEAEGFIPRLGAIRDQAGEAYESSVNVVRRYPVASLLGATALGFLAATFISRRE